MSRADDTRKSRVIAVKEGILAGNSRRADAFREQMRNAGTLFVDVMASPGAGKTSLLIAVAERLMTHSEVGIIEADLASTVDAERIKAIGVDSVEINTRDVCHVEMGMVERAFDAFGESRYDYLFLENIGNLVCPAEFDTGAHRRVVLLSVPEGYDKVYKYPPMFSIADALIVTKSDYLELNPDFDMGRLKQQASVLNPSIRVFETSARTGAGVDELVTWIMSEREGLLEK